MAVAPMNHYRAGEGLVDATPAREHLDGLISATGCTPHTVATAAGVSRDTVVRILDRTHLAITPTVADKVTAVTADMVPIHRVPTGPVREHLTRLHNLGWPDRAVAAVAGVSVATVYQARTGRRATTTADLSKWILTVDEELLRARCPNDDPTLSAHARRHLTQLLNIPGVTVNKVKDTARVSSDTIAVLRAGRAPMPAQSRAILALNPEDLTGPDDDTVRTRLRLLVDLAGSVGAASATGLHRASIRSALAGAPITTTTKEAILRADPVTARPHPHTNVPATATRRRLHALARAGWPMTHIARRVGREGIFEPPGLRTVQVTAASRDMIVELYDDLIRSPGPSEHAAKIAVSKMWASADDWDGRDLTDPDAWPFLPGAPECPVDVISSVVHPWIEGHSKLQVSRQTGIRYNTISDLITTYGAWKLADEPWRSRTGQHPTRVSPNGPTVKRKAG